jgi:hypothetical protein
MRYDSSKSLGNTKKRLHVITLESMGSSWMLSTFLLPLANSELGVWAKCNDIKTNDRRVLKGRWLHLIREYYQVPL